MKNKTETIMTMELLYTCISSNHAWHPIYDIISFLQNFDTKVYTLIL